MDPDRPAAVAWPVPGPRSGEREPLETIRRRLGHANAQTVLRYADQRDITADAEIRTWRRRKITGRPNS